jgi:SAM-dependent methyltransferase
MARKVRADFGTCERKGPASPPSDVADPETLRAFDALSAVYDETREPPDDPAIDRIATILRSWGIHDLLEVGVGTGRVAVPLALRGLAVTGLDGSREMLRRSQAKQLPRLIRGDAYRLPFRDSAFEGTLFVHVLHLLDDPAAALREASRVGPKGTIALVEPAPAGAPDSYGRPEPNPRQLVYEHLRRAGIAIPHRAGGPRFRERQILRERPPAQLAIVREEDVTESLARDLDILERRASRWTLEVPDGLLNRAVAEARERIGERTHSYRKVVALARWTETSLRPRGTAAGGSAT